MELWHWLPHTWAPQWILTTMIITYEIPNMLAPFTALMHPTLSPASVPNHPFGFPVRPCPFYSKAWLSTCCSTEFTLPFSHTLMTHGFTQAQNHFLIKLTPHSFMFQTSDQWFLSWGMLPDLSNQASFSPLNTSHILNFTFTSRLCLHVVLGWNVYEGWCHIWFCSISGPCPLVYCLTHHIYSLNTYERYMEILSLGHMKAWLTFYPPFPWVFEKHHASHLNLNLLTLGIMTSICSVHLRVKCCSDPLSPWLLLPGHAFPCEGDIQGTQKWCAQKWTQHSR